MAGRATGAARPGWCAAPAGWSGCRYGTPRTAAASSRLSRATAEGRATRGVEQAFATLGELRGGAMKLGQAFSLFER